MREARYWEGEEKRVCRMCGGEEETWEHVWEGCRRGQAEEGGWQEWVGTILGEKGEGKDWMREIEKIRKEGEIERGEWEGEEANRGDRDIGEDEQESRKEEEGAR